MRGAAELIAMRQRRRMPSSVVLSLHGRPGVQADESWLMPTPAERPGNTDLRLLVGLRVVVVGPYGSAPDVRAWCKAAERAGAVIVMGYATDSLIGDSVPVFAGGNVAEINRRIATLEAEHGASAA